MIWQIFRDILTFIGGMVLLVTVVGIGLNAAIRRAEVRERRAFGRRKREE